MIGRTLWIASMIVLGVSVRCAAAEELHVVAAGTPEQFGDQAAAIRTEMGTGGRYEFVTATERSTVEARLDDIQTEIARFGNAKSLPRPEMTKVLNAQEEVNAILTRRDDKRLMCDATPKIGSHIAKARCTTYREVELRRRQDKKYMENELMVPGCNNGGCLGGDPHPGGKFMGVPPGHGH